MIRPTSLNIDERICQVCQPCLAAKACRVMAISSIDAGEPPYIDLYLCNDCRLCMPACTFGAVTNDREPAR